MNLNIITGLQVGAAQGAPAGDAATAGAPAQKASPFAMLLAILAGTPTEAQTGAQTPVPPLAQAAFLSPEQGETGEDQSGDVTQTADPQIAGLILPPVQSPHAVLAAAELASSPSADEETAGDAAENIDGDVAPALVPDQPQADPAISAAALAEAALAASQDGNPAAAVQRPQPSGQVPQSAVDQAPAEIAKEIAKVDPLASAGVAVDPKLAVGAPGDGKTPAAAQDLTEDGLPVEQSRGKKQPAAARSAPADAPQPKPDAALNADAKLERSAPLPPADSLKPAELRAADVTSRAPEPIAAAPQADPGAPRPAPAQTPAPQVQVTVPVEGLAIQIARTAKSGERKFEIRLDPPELGKVSVRLEVSREGVVTTHLTVERAETMDLLQRDARALERALGQAGLDQKGGGISFSLSDQNAHPQHDGRDAPGRPYAMAIEEQLSAADTPAQPARFRSATAVLDIRI